MSINNLNTEYYYPEDPTEESVVDDLSMIPFVKDTFAVCELCGRIGRRGQFYPKNTKYCSLRCNVSATRRKHCNWRFKMMEGTEHMAGMIPLEPMPQLHSWHASFDQLQTGPIRPSAANVANSYEWKDELFGFDFLAAPVSLFKHAPLHDMWDNTFEGMKVEVKNTDCENVSEKLGDYFWVASVLKVKGYMGLLRYEGFGSDDSKDFWVNLSCSEVHPVGWCATKGKPLIPPKTIERKYNDWKKFLVKQLTGARTLPANFYTKLSDSVKSRFSVGTVMEVVDKNRISQVKVASVHEIIGKRLHIKYYDSSPEDNGFWCHEDSPLIHPVGWAFRVGHPLDAPTAYSSRVATGRVYPTDAVPEMFYNFPKTDPPLFTKGTKIEAIDPLNLSSICAATVMEILSEGYMMIRIESYPPDESGSDWFCYHQRSPCIFPVGFAHANNISMVPPTGYTSENFKWEEYLNSCNAMAADQSLFSPRGHLVSHGFVAGMRLECTDLMDPRLVCVATVARVVADLLKIHFDGWGDEYDQWLWAHSTDIYPVGWCKAVGHRLEGPLQPPPRPPRPAKKPRVAKAAKRRKRPLAPQNSQAPNTNEESSQNSDAKSMSPFSGYPPSEISAVVDTRHSAASEGNSQSMDVGDPKESGTALGEQDSHMETDANEGAASMPTRESESEPPSDNNDNKVIPRLVNNTSVPLDILNSVEPDSWTTEDVGKFLTINDCQPYCVNFSNITGPMMLQLTKDEIIELLEMKVGPSLKIFDLIQQLKSKLKQPQRNLGNLK